MLGLARLATLTPRTILIGAVLWAGQSMAPDTAVAQSRFASMSCGQLWYQRNAIFARAGYCFKTPQAIGAFGRGCFAPYGQLSPGAQSTVDEIQYWEGRKGCN